MRPDRRHPAPGIDHDRERIITAGESAQQKGETTLAATLYGKAISADPRSGIALYDLGDLEQVATGDDAAAEGNYRRALAIDRSSMPCSTSAILETVEHPTVAIDDYAEVTKLDATDAGRVPEPRIRVAHRRRTIRRERRDRPCHQPRTLAQKTPQPLRRRRSSITSRGTVYDAYESARTVAMGRTERPGEGANMRGLRTS